MSGPGFTPGPWFAVGARVLARSKNQLDEDEALSIADVDMDVRIDVDGEGAVNAALIAAAPELYEALDGVEQLFALHGETSIERFERIAAQFYSDTGLLAPGKDAPAAGNQPDHPERRAAYDTWINAKVDRARAALAKARGETP